MRLPEISARSLDGDEVVLNLELAADHEAFRGHFPEQPILAGVLQVDWAMRFAAECFGLAQTSAQDFQVKFRRVIGPEVEISLALTLDRPRAAIVFEYRRDGEIASSGRIRLEAAP